MTISHQLSDSGERAMDKPLRYGAEIVDTNDGTDDPIAVFTRAYYLTFDPPRWGRRYEGDNPSFGGRYPDTAAALAALNAAPPPPNWKPPLPAAHNGVEGELCSEHAAPVEPCPECHNTRKVSGTKMGGGASLHDCPACSDPLDLGQALHGSLLLKPLERAIVRHAPEIARMLAVTLAGEMRG